MITSGHVADALLILDAGSCARGIQIINSMILSLSSLPYVSEIPLTSHALAAASQAKGKG